MDSCEKCEERERMKEIMDSFEKKENKKEVTKEGYQQLAKFSYQLRDCLHDMARFYKEMSKIYEECKKKDIKQDSGELKKLLESMRNYSEMETVNAKVLLETIEILLRQIYG